MDQETVDYCSTRGFRALWYAEQGEEYDLVLLLADEVRRMKIKVEYVLQKHHKERHVYYKNEEGEVKYIRLVYSKKPQYNEHTGETTSYREWMQFESKEKILQIAEYESDREFLVDKLKELKPAIDQEQRLLRKTLSTQTKLFKDQIKVMEAQKRALHLNILQTEKKMQEANNKIRNQIEENENDLSQLINQIF